MTNPKVFTCSVCMCLWCGQTIDGALERVHIYHFSWRLINRFYEALSDRQSTLVQFFFFFANLVYTLALPIYVIRDCDPRLSYLQFRLPLSYCKCLKCRFQMKHWLQLVSDLMGQHLRQRRPTTTDRYLKSFILVVVTWYHTIGCQSGSMPLIHRKESCHTTNDLIRVRIRVHQSL